MHKESVARGIELPSQDCCGCLALFRLLNRSCAGTLLPLLASLGSIVAGNAATLLTDKPDYFPGEHVIFSGAGDNFAGGDKVDDDPNTWGWTLNPVGNKQDINNALLHIAKDANGHTWIMIAGDRQSDNGAAYIDFEFLQNEFLVTTNGAGTGGGFMSYGPNCGRTTNDFILTLSFTHGGNTAGLCLSRWVATNTQPCGFDYVDATADLPAGAVFAAVNTNV